MKKRFLLLLPLLCLTACSYGVDPNKTFDNVYLIMGQSNASGCCKASFLETKDPETYAKYKNGFNNVEITYDVDDHVNQSYVPVHFGIANTLEFFGPEIGISDVLSTVNEKSYIIKASWSGSSLQADYVNKDGDTFKLYDRFVPFIKKQLKKLQKEGKNPRVRGLFWMQGESDSWEGLCDNYGPALEWFVKKMREELNNYVYEYMNFVDAYISTKTIWTFSEKVNAAKQNFSNVALHNYCFKTNGEDENAIDLGIKAQTGEDPNDWAHYDSTSMVALGREAGKYLIK